MRFYQISSWFYIKVNLLRLLLVMEEEGPLKRIDLAQFVYNYQKRTYAEDVEALAQKGSTVQWLAKNLGTSLTEGISNHDSDLKARRDRYGTNAKKQIELPGLCQLLWQALKDFTLRILLFAACLSIVLQTSTASGEDRSIAWISGFAMLVAVFVCAMVTAVNDYQKQRQFQQLNNVADDKKIVSVRRGGQRIELHMDQLLVGDIVDITEGMQIPADGVLIESNQITTNESAMTGESQAINKNVLLSCIKKKEDLQKQGDVEENNKLQVPSPILMSGTNVLTGQGKMLVLVVGQLSCIGKIRELLEHQDAVKTPLQQKLQKLAGDIGRFGLYSAIFIVIVLLIRFGIDKGTADNEEDKWQTGRDLVHMLDFLILGITVIVVAIPEGLPLSVTLSLAFSVKKMLQDNNLVRRMEACQTMGGANNICSDKTGTLTMNKMTVSRIWNGTDMQVDNSKDSLRPQDLSLDGQYLQLFKIASLVNSSAHLNPQKGSSTEIAFLKYFQRMKIDYITQRQQMKVEVRYPFSSSRKRMSIITAYKGQLHLFTKGASEIILASCQDMYNQRTGNIEPIDKNQVERIIHQMAENSLRTLGLAFKKLSGHDNFEDKDKRGVFEVEKQNLILIAIVGVRDTPRPEVPRAIQQCHQAGITVRMVTGDNIITAKAIAREIGLDRINKNFIAMEGPQFSKEVGGVVCKKCQIAICDCPTNPKQAEEKGVEMRVDTIANKERFDQIIQNLLILARSRPEDKFCIVTGLKERGNVVAVTGDGTNDAPALKKADVGFAMGIAGTEVARQAAAIILVDDNFNSIVKAVLWGRNIYDSIRKFIQFQLTVNVVAVVITLLGAALLRREVLKPIQMLWINLIMDTLASIALTTEDPHPDLLLRKPHSRDDYIISSTMLKHIIGQSIFQITIMLIFIFMGETFIPEYADSNDTQEPYFSHPEYKWRDGVIGGNICSGRFYSLSGEKDYYTAFEETKIYSRHFTMVFNVFVMMQIFNFINDRKLRQELNVFSGIFKHPIFLIIVFLILGIQIILVSFAGYAFGLYNKGLTIQQWLICAGFGAISLVVNLIIKLLPIAQEKPIDAEAKVMPELSGTAEIENSKIVINSFNKFGAMKIDLQDSSDMILPIQPNESFQ